MKQLLNLFFASIILVTGFNTANAQDGNTNTPKAAKSNITTLYKQLGVYLKTTAQQNAKAIPILSEYDVSIDAIKAKNTGNAAKTEQEVNAQSSKTFESLKKVLNGEQALKFLVAVTTQNNILSGKNLDANQKAFIAKAKNQYKLSDEQLTSVALVMVQGKLRGDGIAQLAKVNPQQAGQEYIKLFQDLDEQLKASLSDEQYKNVKADIEKLVKGQKV
jgi:hypothetical protein